jgi:hypothetical protein
MGLTVTQKSIINKVQSVGGSQQGVALNDEQCAYLVAVVKADLELSERKRPDGIDLPPFFGIEPLEEMRLDGVDFVSQFESLIASRPDADAYFDCLASLHKARLKYERILQQQPVPTLDQVGPRGLLQYGRVATKALTPFLLWRKWLYDIDNRAAQETGYVFEPIIARAIGGTPAPASKSPVKRQAAKSQGRQVDCLLGTCAHEIKIRVTIASSGQGRWAEELSFPLDCQSSGYTPVLVVLDPTPNDKLTELEAQFRNYGGQAYIGEQAWEYLEAKAGPTMSRFLERYVHEPLRAILSDAPDAQDGLPDLLLHMTRDEFVVAVNDETLLVRRAPNPNEASDATAMPDDADAEVPGL